MQQALGAEATAVRSQSYYLDVTPPGCDKGTFVQAMARRLGISTDAVATIGDMQNDLAMFRKSGISIAMGNATDDVKQAGDACHGLERGRGFCQGDRDDLEENEAENSASSLRKQGPIAGASR